MEQVLAKELAAAQDAQQVAFAQLMELQAKYEDQVEDNALLASRLAEAAAEEEGAEEKHAALAGAPPLRSPFCDRGRPHRNSAGHHVAVSPQGPPLYFLRLDAIGVCRVGMATTSQPLSPRSRAGCRLHATATLQCMDTGHSSGHTRHGYFLRLSLAADLPVSQRAGCCWSTLLTPSANPAGHGIPNHNYHAATGRELIAICWGAKQKVQCRPRQ